MSAALLVQIVASVSVVFASAWAASRLMGGRSAAARHLTWALALGLAIVLPIVTLAGPTWQLPVLAVKQTVAVASFDSAELPILLTRAGAAPPALRVPRLRSERPEHESKGATPVGLAAAENAAVPATDTAFSIPNSLDPLRVLLVIWGAGALLALLRLAGGLARVAWISSHATLVKDLGWRVALAESCRALSIRPNVALRTSAQTSVPVTCGVWRRSILLPADASGWSDDRRRVVLLHELAHVKRGDCLTQVVTQVSVALHWFNPLAHLAARRLRLEQERACDDLVLLSGTEPPAYADHLVELARAVRTRGLPAWATLAMAQPSQLEGRLRAILDHQQLRRTASPRVRALASSIVLLAALPLGAIRLTAADQTPAPVPAPIVQTPAAQPVPVPEPAPAPLPQSTPRSVEAPPVPAPWRAYPESVSAPHFAFDHPPTVEWFNHLTTHPDPYQAYAQAAQVPADPAEEAARKRAAEALGTALNDENERVRQAAVQALASMRDPRAIPALVRALQSSDVAVRQMAVNSLRRFDTDEAIAGLVTAMKDSSPEVRMQAAASLSGSTNTRAIDALTAALKDSDPRVRERAASSLGSIASGRKGRPFADVYIDQLKLQDTVVRVQNAEQRARVAAELAALQGQVEAWRAQLTRAQQQNNLAEMQQLQQKMEELRVQISPLQEKLRELNASPKVDVFAPVPAPPAPPAAPTAPAPPAPAPLPPR